MMFHFCRADHHFQVACVLLLDVDSLDYESKDHQIVG